MSHNIKGSHPIQDKNQKNLIATMYNIPSYASFYNGKAPSMPTSAYTRLDCPHESIHHSP